LRFVVAMFPPGGWLSLKHHVWALNSVLDHRNDYL